MPKPKKHGMWFDFTRHIDIHDNVLAGYENSMVSSTKYTKTWKSNNTFIEHYVKFEFAHNGYTLEITKESQVSYINHKKYGRVPHEAKTTYFNYVAINQSKNHHIRYCSPHDTNYDSNRPWHNKDHRHESMVSGQESILIYSKDDRPFTDRLKKKFKVGKVNVSIQYDVNDDWPLLGEFFADIYKL